MKQLRGQDTVVDSSLMETSAHGTEGFPLAVYLDDFSYFKNDGICWHWHGEAQITYVTEGEFICHVGSDKLRLRPGDIIFINSRALHQIIPTQRSSGKLYAYLWRPELLGRPGGDLYKNCIEPLITSPLRYAFFSTEHEQNRQIQTALRAIAKAMTDRLPFFEMHVCNQLARIWLRICEQSAGGTAELILREKDEEKVKLAMAYIQSHYAEKLSLEEIAKAALTNRSELCRCFRRVLDLSPNEFILQYRLSRALSLLEDPERRIADIAISCGFCSPSHFGSHFARHLGCTPLQYRKSI